MTSFTHQNLFELTSDKTEYRHLTSDFVSQADFDGNPVIKIERAGLEMLAEAAFADVSHFHRTQHLEGLRAILDDSESSENDSFVALEMLKNAVISAEGVFPMCQDTGTAMVIAKKGQSVWTGFSDEEALSKGIFEAFQNRNLRYSQNAPLTMFEEKNTGTNLPAQVDIFAADGEEYNFLFMAKGGGSANKTFMFPESKAILTPEKLPEYIKDKMLKLGTAGCPPYHLAIAVGGTSGEANLKAVKLASAGYLDALPNTGNELGRAFRDREVEGQVLEISRQLGIGAQFGGKYFCHDVRVIRLPRHGASCFMGIGVSCSADRNIKAKITKDGIFLEKLDDNPARFLPESGPESKSGTTAGENGSINIDLNRPMDEIRAELSKYPVATRLSLSGSIIVARDMAHAKIKERLDRAGGSGDSLPDYLKNHIIYYAGPAKTPDGYASGSFGPTTAGRMDSYVPEFQALGASLVMLAKGNRTKAVTESCNKHGGFYLGSIGGTAARLGRDYITSAEVVEFSEFGMEAVFMITVKDFPAFIIVDDKGNDFFEGLL